MKSLEGIGLKDVQAVYSGPEGDLWELIMGQQIHIGGFKSSMDLAQRAGIKSGTTGVDLCCCNGAGMRFLVRFMGVEGMTGVDATETVVQRGIRRCEDEGLSDKIQFVLGDVCDSGIESGSADFVWGEDAWCYVEDKGRLISEAARIVRPGGTVAFTDWLEGAVRFSSEESERLLKFMKFPSIQTLEGYSEALRGNGCSVLIAEDTGRYAPCIDLYLDVIENQLTYDALRIIGFDTTMMAALADEMQFMRRLAHDGKLIQGLIVARKS